MSSDLYFLITSNKPGVASVLFGKDEDGYRIYPEFDDGRSPDKYDMVQDHLDVIIDQLAELISNESIWKYNDTGKTIWIWDALVEISRAEF